MDVSNLVTSSQSDLSSTDLKADRTNKVRQIRNPLKRKMLALEIKIIFNRLPLKEKLHYQM